MPGIGRRTAEAIVAALPGRPGRAAGPRPAGTGRRRVDAGRGAEPSAGAGRGRGRGPAGVSVARRRRRTTDRSVQVGPISGEPIGGRGRRARRRATADGARSGTAADTDLVVVTGVSGGGRSTVARALENVGFYVVDNLPQALMLDMAELAYAGRRRGPAHRDGARRAQPGVLHRPGRRGPGAAGARLLAAGALRRRRRRGADPAVRERAPVAPAAGRRPARRRHRGRARRCSPRRASRPT